MCDNVARPGFHATSARTDSTLPAPLVVYDIDLPPFMENRAFDAELMRRYPGGSAGAALAQQLDSYGVRIQTADVFLRDPREIGRAVVYSNETTRFTRTLIRELGIPGALCSSGESPIVAWRFYSALPEVSAWYRNVCLWPGTRQRVAPSTHFEPLYWPYPDLKPTEFPDLPERGFLTLISSNKRAFGWPEPLFDVRHPRFSSYRLRESWQASRARRGDPWLSTELYVDRLQAIRHFGMVGDFDLHGRGWAEPAAGADRATRAAIRRSYRGEIPALEKLKVLERYEFCLCFENCAFPGYVTEKIFDCLVAGTIPVYLGAPDIADHVPRGAFIDYRDFADYAHLEDHLRGLSTEDAEAHRSAAREFLGSPSARKYTQAHHVSRVARMLLDALEDQ
jgi:hypothetical protein